MHAYANSTEPGPDGQRPWGREHRRCGRLGWKPLEIAAMVLGFMVFWPIGLAIIFLKISQRNAGHQGPLFDYARERWDTSYPARMWAKWGDGNMWQCKQRAERTAREWGGFGMRSTGNSAFDDWRSAELARLEEERRKLAAAEREFADYMDGLRRARDREEFDRFMNQRKSAPPSDAPQAN